MQTSYIEIDKYGTSDLLKFKSKEVSESLKDDEVQIDVHYSGINFADIVMRLGMYRDAPPKPFTPGYEISGVVKKIGSSVTRFKVGDQVMAGTRFGGYTSSVTLPEWQVLNLPAGFSLAEGAASPVTFLTAHIALHEFGRIRKGDKVLLDCATGGVGVMAMQMCKDVGAECIGLTSSESKKTFIESYGAKAYTQEEFEKSGEKDFDFILNSSGGKSLKAHYEILGKSGKLTCIGVQSAITDGKANIFKVLKTIIQIPKFSMLKLTMQSKSVSGFNALKYFDDNEWMKKNLPKIETCPYKPHIGEIFAAKDVSEAHRFLEQRKAKGKVLLSWVK